MDINETVTIRRIAYKVVRVLEPKDVGSYQSDLMREQGKIRFLYLRRLNGRATYHVAEYKGGLQMVSMGRS